MRDSVYGTCFVATLAMGMVAASTIAHGPQIQIGIENGIIVTRGLFSDEPYNTAVTPKQRVYEIPMAERNLGDANDGWYAQPNISFLYTGPGVATELGGFSTGTIITLTFSDGLRIWNGASFVDPGTEQIDAYRGATHVAFAITSDTGPFQSFSFTPISNGDDEHKTAFFRMLGDGVAPDSPSDDGVYLLSLRLLSDQIGVTPSAPYYFLLNKNATSQELEDASDYVYSRLLSQGVPVVSTGGIGLTMIGLLAAGLLAFGTLIRRHARPAC